MRLNGKTALITAAGQGIGRATALAHPGDAVVLSPACSSYDMFKNFGERGMVFRAACEKAGVKPDELAAFIPHQANLRIIDANTMLLTPTLWSATPTYYVGSIVADQNGTLWESIVRSNLNNQPDVPPVPPAWPTWSRW